MHDDQDRSQWTTQMMTAAELATRPIATPARRLRICDEALTYGPAHRPTDRNACAEASYLRRNPSVQVVQTVADIAMPAQRLRICDGHHCFPGATRRPNRNACAEALCLRPDSPVREAHTACGIATPAQRTTYHIGEYKQVLRELIEVLQSEVPHLSYVVLKETTMAVVKEFED